MCAGKYGYTILENTWQCKSSCQVGQYLCPAGSASDSCMDCKGTNYSKCMMHVSTVQLPFVQCLCWSNLFFICTTDMLLLRALPQYSQYWEEIMLTIHHICSPLWMLACSPTSGTAVFKLLGGMACLIFTTREITSSLLVVLGPPGCTMSTFLGFAWMELYHGPAGTCILACIYMYGECAWTDVLFILKVCCVSKWKSLSNIIVLCVA